MALLLGAMGIFGVQFNMANFFAVPLLVGIGVDFGVQVTHRLRRDRSFAAMGSSTGRALIMTAAASHVPPALLEQLLPGGRMILPLGTQEQFLWMIDKQEDGSIQKTRLDPVRFVPLLNGQQ